ncbi:MAG: sugar transferase [Agathobacter sp.]|nr:sugar transferase [Agathobacter sp.]
MYRKKTNNWLKHLDFELIDIICMEASFFLTYAIRHMNMREAVNVQMYLNLGIWLLVFDVIAVVCIGSYKNILQRNKWQELLEVIKHVSLIEVMLLLYEYVTKEAGALSRAVFLSSWVLSVISCWVFRVLWKNILRTRILKKKSRSNMLVISNKEHIDTCIKRIRRKRYVDFNISAVALLGEEEKPERIDANIPIIIGYDPLVEYVRQGIVDEVFIDTFTSAEELEQLTRLFLQMGIAVHIGMGFIPEDLPNVFMEKIGSCDSMTTTIKTASGFEIAAKRLMDIVGGAVGLILAGIAFLFVAPAIQKASPGPVFFSQKRVGKNGRVFSIYKFRSMYMYAEERKKDLMEQNEMQGLMFKMENDPRIIGSEKGPGKGIGNFIRKTSIDELPQFWNILKGDMSLVGTRPPTIGEYEQYDVHHKIRLSMKPGLTGMWQTSGRSDITDFEEVVKLDSLYIEQWSLWLDIKLLLKTIKVVLAGSGSK